MVNYIEALKLIDKAGQGDFINVISNFFLYIVIILGAVLSLIALGEVENFLDNGVVEKKKRMGILIFGILIMFLIFSHFNQKHPPDYSKKEVKKIAKTFGISHPEYLSDNIEYLRTIAPAYVKTKDKETEEIDNDLWINLKLDEFYNNKKIDPENKKIFENLKK